MLEIQEEGHSQSPEFFLEDKLSKWLFITPLYLLQPMILFEDKWTSTNLTYILPYWKWLSYVGIL